MNVYDILETCLSEIEQGVDVDTVLFRHPEHADELRPILEASVKARAMAAAQPSADVVRRNRAKVMQRAAEMREVRVKPSSSHVWLASLRRLAVTLAVVMVLFVSGTGLVGASANTLPGDNLYPVKRTWEDVLVFFAFDPQQREALEFEHENERLEELTELLAEGRSEQVGFSGYVTRQAGTEWRVSGITVSISSQTVLLQPVTLGDAVQVDGVTQMDGTVLAERVSKLPADTQLPQGNDNDAEIEQENANGSDTEMEENSNSGNENESPVIEETSIPGMESEPTIESFEGTLESIDSKNVLWVVSGQKLDVRAAEILGVPVIGATVNVEGFLGADGVFIAMKIEVLDSTNDNDASTPTGNDNQNGNDNGGDDDNGNNDNDSDDDNDNDNDGDNSGSGGGDD